MKRFLYIIFTILAPLCYGQKTALNARLTHFTTTEEFIKEKVDIPLYTISGRIISYDCPVYQGVEDPEFMNPKWFYRKYTRLYLRRGSVNDTNRVVIKDFQSDSTGKFQFKLSAGVYSVITAEQIHPLTADLKEGEAVADGLSYYYYQKGWWKNPLYVLKVNADIEELELIYPVYCPPPTGPMPM